MTDLEKFSLWSMPSYFLSKSVDERELVNCWHACQWSIDQGGDIKWSKEYWQARLVLIEEEFVRRHLPIPTKY